MKRLPWLLVILLSLGAVSGCDGNRGVRAASSLVRIGSEVQLGHPYVGDRAAGSFPIRAVGDGALRVLRVTTTHPQLVIDWGAQPGGVVIARGASVDVTVAWTPTEPGPIDSTIEVELELEGAAHHTVRVTGEARALPPCDDGNECTDDHFDRPSGQCVHVNHERACNDGNACTEADRCQAGVCKGTGVTCDDGNVCTLDFCDPTSGCVHPPDDRQCDDGDPCTDDTCDPAAGCTHSGNTGNTCGTLTCATAHLCVAGTCREVDISASSDGAPCSDGNFCTEGEQCLAGVCQGGVPRISETKIVATLDTYGGENSYVATDGERYLFVDRVRAPDGFLANVSDPKPLLIATYDGNELNPRGSLPIFATVAPVAIQPGLFAVPSSKGPVLIDATDPDNPNVVWEGVSAPRDSLGITKMIALRHGLVAYGYYVTHPLNVVYYGAEYFTFDSLPQPAWQTLQISSSVDDIDGDGDRLVMSDSNGVTWVQLDASGNTVASGVLTPTPGPDDKVSIQGKNVALLRLDAIELFNIDTPKFRVKVPAFGATDIELVGTTLFSSTADKVWANTIDNIDAAVANGGLTGNPLVEMLGSETIERGPGHLLLRGEIALPLKLSGGSATMVPTLTRITGTGHGSVTVSTDSAGGKVQLGSRTSIGEVDLETQQFARWSLLPHAPGKAEGYLLKGASRPVPITRSISISDGPLGDCDGPTWSELDATGNAGTFKACGLMSGDVTATRGALWSATVLSRTMQGSTPRDSRGLRAWALDPFQPFRVLEIPDPQGWASQWVRASDSQEYVGWFLGRDWRSATAPAGWQAGQRITLLKVTPGSASAIAVGQFAVEDYTQNYYSPLVLEGNGFAVDEEAALTVSGGFVRLHPLMPMADAPPVVPGGSLSSVTLPDAQYPRSSSSIAWMADGKAWVAWQATQNQVSSPSPFRLADVRYDAQKNTLEYLGDVTLSAPVTSVYQTSEYAVATTNNSVAIIAPACR